MSYEGSPVKAPLASRRRMMPPTPQQSPHSSIEDIQWQTEMEVHGSSWDACERTVIVGLEQDCLKLESEELELLLGPEDSEINLRYLLCKVLTMRTTVSGRENVEVFGGQRCHEGQHE